MAHNELHATCLEYLTKTAQDYKTVETIATAKDFWNKCIQNINKIQDTIAAYEETQAFNEKMAKKGIQLQTTMQPTGLRKELGLPETPVQTAPDIPKNESNTSFPAPKYTDAQKVLIKRQPNTWSVQKRQTVHNNPEVHPDSILNNGSITKNYWTWDEVEYLNECAGELPLETIVEKLPEHSKPEITTMMASLGLDYAEPITPIETQPKLSLEVYLPDAVKQPPLATRLRIFRLLSNLTVSQISSKSGIDKKRIYAIENGDETPQAAVLEKLAAVYNTTADDLLKKPVFEIIPFDAEQTPTQRIRIARIRCGQSVESFANRIGEYPERLLKYETGSIAVTHELCDKIERVFKIPAWLTFTANPDNAPTKQNAQDSQRTFENHTLSTGEKLIKYRTAKGLSITDLARKANCSVAHISSIEAQRTHPSDDMLIKLSRALGIQTWELSGDNIRQPNAVFKEKSERRKTQTEKARAATQNDDFAVQTKLTNARISLRLTISQLAEKSGVPEEHIINLESKGKTGGNGFFYRKLCSYLNIEP